LGRPARGRASGTSRAAPRSTSRSRRPPRRRSAPAPARRRSRSSKEIDPDDLEEAIEDELDEDEDFGEDGRAGGRRSAVRRRGRGDEDGEDEESEAAEADDEEGDEYEEDDESEAEDGDDEEPLELAPAARRAPAKRVVPKLAKELPFEPPTPPAGDWKLPPMELLVTPDRSAELDNAAIEAAARKLEHALASFRVEAQVVGAQVGPTVILFELEVSQGTRMNKVTQLSQEIAAALRAQSVRIIAPIPGKATIGIEVPNVKRRVGAHRGARQRQGLRQEVRRAAALHRRRRRGSADRRGPVAHAAPAHRRDDRLGQVGVHQHDPGERALTRSPHDVQMILIDPKMVELQMFAHIPHLMLPVVTDMRQATNVLFWAVEKMEGRYELFKDAGVKNVKAYNALSESELRTRMGANWNEERTPRHVPYIVVVIDEFADLMMASKKEAEQAITRLAQKSRAVGIHVILATQRPSTDVITGVIKGNLPTRIAFQVASKVDSRVILDAQGAEKLLGGGDMLYTPPSSSRIKRVQGALVEDVELQRLVEFVCKDSAPSFNQELVQVATGTAQPGAGAGFESALEDEMWDEAVRVILKSKRGSASLLQRALGIGYTRASRLLDMMGEAGIVSDHKGSKAREVLMTLEDWEEAHGAPAGGPDRNTSGDER
jgi:S-DNA-T family DNA segregation ATPase FtsK/SpoIIIE